MVIEMLEQTIITALQRAHHVHEELGPRGREIMRKNQFGDTTLRADLEMERAIIATLTEAAAPVQIVSEEHGRVVVGKAPALLGVLDGLDGSSVYRRQQGKGRYGTMVGLFSNSDPTYSEYLCCGVMIHTPLPQLFFATKAFGSFVLEGTVRKHVHCKHTAQLSKGTKIYIDENFDVNREVFSSKLQGFDTMCTNSSAVHYADVAAGLADVALECTRKQNLEVAVAYGLVVEAGGVIVTLDGISLAQKHYLTFGQNVHIPIVTAATHELALDIIRHVSSSAVS